MARRHRHTQDHSGKGPKGFHRSDDRIRDDVCHALYESREVDASNIDVEVKDGCVFLRGEVQNRQMKKMAEEAVDNVFGILDVQNHLTFKREEAYLSTKNLPEEFSGRTLS